MGETKPLPTAREAIGEAISAAFAGNADMALAWTAIARELREGSRPQRDALGTTIVPRGEHAREIDLTAVRRKLRDSEASPERDGRWSARSDEVLKEYRQKVGEARAAAEEHEANEVAQADRELAPAPPQLDAGQTYGDLGLDPVIAMAQRAEAAAGVGLDVTQQITQVPWSVGDVSDCLFCNTPIFLCRMDVFGGPPGGAKLLRGGEKWLHKYSNQAVCASPALAQGDSSVPSGHAWATPMRPFKSL